MPPDAPAPTPAELAAGLRADLEVCDAASPGPWFAIDSIRQPDVYSVDGRLEFDDDESTFAWGIAVGDAEEGYFILHGENYHSIPEIQNDIDFAAAARTRWPAACELALALLAENEAVVRDRDGERARADAAEAEAGRLRAELAARAGGGPTA